MRQIGICSCTVNCVDDVPLPRSACIIVGERSRSHGMMYWQAEHPVFHGVNQPLWHVCQGVLKAHHTEALKEAMLTSPDNTVQWQGQSDLQSV